MNGIILSLSIALFVASCVMFIKIYESYLKILEVHKNKCQQYDMLLSGMMYQLMKDSIAKEDYEMANKCKSIIDKIGTDKVVVSITENK